MKSSVASNTSKLLCAKLFVGISGFCFVSKEKIKQNKTRIPFRNCRGGVRWEIHSRFLKFPHEHWQILEQRIWEAECWERLETRGGMIKAERYLIFHTLLTFELWSCFIEQFTHIKHKILSVNIHSPTSNRKHLSDALLGSGNAEMNKRPAVPSRYFQFHGGSRTTLDNDNKMW